MNKIKQKDIILSILDLIDNIISYPSRRRYRKAIEHLEDPLVVQEGNTIYIGDCPFKIMNKNKHKVILYNESRNNIILIDNYDRTRNEITDVLLDVRICLLYYKVINCNDLVIVVRCDEGLTNDYHVFENMSVENIISNQLSFTGICNLLSSRNSYFLG